MDQLQQRVYVHPTLVGQLVGEALRGIRRRAGPRHRAPWRWRWRWRWRVAGGGWRVAGKVATAADV
jgi:hypothetical protein